MGPLCIMLNSARSLRSRLCLAIKFGFWMLFNHVGYVCLVWAFSYCLCKDMWLSWPACVNMISCLYSSFISGNVSLYSIVSEMNGVFQPEIVWHIQFYCDAKCWTSGNVSRYCRFLLEGTCPCQRWICRSKWCFSLPPFDSVVEESFLYLSSNLPLVCLWMPGTFLLSGCLGRTHTRVSCDLGNHSLAFFSGRWGFLKHLSVLLHC